MHKKIKILLASLSICFMFLLNTSSVFAVGCRTDYPSAPSDDIWASTSYNKSDYPYYMITTSCNNYNSTGGGKLDFAYYSFSSVPFKNNSNGFDGSISIDGPNFRADAIDGGSFDVPSYSFFGLNLPANNLNFSNHTIYNADGSELFLAPWMVTDAFRPVGERIQEAVPIIVGLTACLMALVVCLVVLAKHFRKLQRV